MVLAFLSDPLVVRRTFAHLGLPTAAPPLAPARDPFDVGPQELGPGEPGENAIPRNVTAHDLACVTSGAPKSLSW